MNSLPPHPNPLPRGRGNSQPGIFDYSAFSRQIIHLDFNGQKREPQISRMNADNDVNQPATKFSPICDYLCNLWFPSFVESLSFVFKLGLLLASSVAVFA